MKKIFLLLIFVLLVSGCSNKIEKDKVYVIQEEKETENCQEIDMLVSQGNEHYFKNDIYIGRVLSDYQEKNNIKINYYFESEYNDNKAIDDSEFDIIFTSYSDSLLNEIDLENYYNNKDIYENIPDYFDESHIIAFSLSKPGYLFKKSQLNQLYENEDDYINLSFEDIYMDWVKYYNIDDEAQIKVQNYITSAFPNISNYTDFDPKNTIDFIKEVIRTSDKEMDIIWKYETEDTIYNYDIEIFKFLLLENLNIDSDFNFMMIYDELNPNMLSASSNRRYEGYGAFLLLDSSNLTSNSDGFLVRKNTESLYEVKKLITYLLDKDTQMKLYDKGIDGFTPIYIDLYDKMNNMDFEKGYKDLAAKTRNNLRKELLSGKKILSKPLDMDVIFKLRSYNMRVFDFIKTGNFEEDDFENIFDELIEILND